MKTVTAEPASERGEGLTVLDEGLRASEASVDSRHVERTLPVPTLKTRWRRTRMLSAQG